MDTSSISTLLNGTGLMLGSGGLNWPNIIGGLIFGLIGFIAFQYGRKEKSLKPTMIGLGLMIYPYFVPDTVLLYIVGVVLTAVLYFWRD